MKFNFVPKMVWVPKAVRRPKPTVAAIPTRLTVLCDGNNGRNHPLPSRCAFTRATHSTNGAIAAGYTCPLCGKRQNFVFDHQTGRPRLLWVG